MAAGADALGFVCYERSPRFVTPERLRGLALGLPAFVTPVLLFVNATTAHVNACLAQMPQALLQFHGDEQAADCERFARPYVRALRMAKEVDLLDCARSFRSAVALLADAPAPRFGGGGETFDWQRLPPPEQRGRPLILAGGLDEANVGTAIFSVRPFAVDVSSGVEVKPGVKSAERVQRFCAAVRAADRRLYAETSGAA